jgi:hypothetical protein
MSGSPIDLKQLIYKTASASRQTDADIMAAFDDAETPTAAIEESLKAQVPDKLDGKAAAKIWMSSAKFVTPAVNVGIALTSDLEQADAVASRILEQSTITAFANVVDAYSCGASFNKENIFGLYRYSLSNASNCTAYLAYMHNKVIADFGKLLTAHLCEMATGIQPLTLRSVVEHDINSQISTEHSRAVLRSYLNSEYPATKIDAATSIQVSMMNALSRAISSHMIRTKSRPEKLVLQEIIESSVIDSMERWVVDTKRATNGNILNGVDDRTKAMIVQNAINMVSAVTGCATDKMLAGDISSIYSEQTISKITELSDRLLGRVIKKTNSYASVFAKNGERVFDAIEDAVLPYEQGHTKSPITTNGWLALFELPTKLCRYLTKEIASDPVLETANIFASFDHILLGGIRLAGLLAHELKVHDDWAIKTLSNDTMLYCGEMSNRELNASELDVVRITQIVNSTSDAAISAGYKRLIDETEKASVMPLSALKISIASSTVRLAALLTGVHGSANKYALIEKLQKTIIHKVSALTQALYEPVSTDASVMKYSCAYSAITQAAIDQLRHELRFNLSSSQDNVVDDYLAEAHLYARVNSGIETISDIIKESVDHGAKRISQITLDGTATKKVQAAEPRPVHAALKL